MKNCSRSKLFVCFKPIDIDPDDQIIDCVAVSKMMSRNSSSTTLSNEKKMSLRRSFSAVFKSAMYQTSLSKRVRDIQRSKSLCQLLNSDLYKQSSTTNKNRNHKSGSSTTPALITGGSSSPSSSFGSSDISETDNLRSCSEDDDHEEEVAKINGRKKEGTIIRSVGRRRKGLSLNHVIYLVGVSLLVTVLWGKFLAVVITTVWIFFAPVFRRGLSLEKCTSTRLRFLLSNLSRS